MNGVRSLSLALSIATSQILFEYLYLYSLTDCEWQPSLVGYRYTQADTMCGHTQILAAARIQILFCRRKRFCSMRAVCYFSYTDSVSDVLLYRTVLFCSALALRSHFPY